MLTLQIVMAGRFTVSDLVDVEMIVAVICTYLY